jgi:hypothetical protein
MNQARFLRLVAVCAVTLASVTLAVAGPPNGFVAAGRLYTSHNGPGDTKDDRSINLPANTKLDFSFHQTGGLSTSGGGASSNLSSGDIPAGFYVECNGTTDHGKRWAVLKPYSGQPILTGTGFDANGMVSQYTFTLGLYSDVGTGIGAGFYGGSNTLCDVWYKTKSN